MNPPETASGLQIRRSMSSKVLVLILLVSSVVTFVTTLLEIGLDYRQERAGIEHGFELIEKSSLSSVSKALWDMNDSNLDLHIKGIQRLPDIKYVEVRSLDGLSASSGAKPDAKYTIEKSYPLEYLHEGKTWKLGMLIVMVDLRGVYTRLYQTIFIIFSAQLVRTLLITLAIYAIVHYLLTRPLVQVAGYLKRMEFGLQIADLKLDRKVSVAVALDEFDVLVMVVNEMREKLTLSYRELNKFATDLEQKVKEKTQLLLVQQQSLEKAQTLAKLGVWKWKLDEDFSYWSPEFHQILGLSSGEAPGVPLMLSIVHSEDRARFESAVSACCRSGEESQLEFRIQTPSGELRHCTFLCQLEVDSATVARSFLGILQDISDRMTLEALRSERNAAEKANQLKSLFLANISHELRTPMHGILSFSKFGQQRMDTAPKEKLKSYFDMIHESGVRLMALLNDLLDLSKLEANKVVYSMEEQDLAGVAQLVCAELNAFAEEKGVTLKLRCSDGSAVGVFDREKIMQVIRNLVSNAIKFSNKGSTVWVVPRQYASKVSCSVINNGVGIPASELETVFDKFVQSSKTKTGAGGTGLGLSICKEIVAHHGGRIWVESELGADTRFTFELPNVGVVFNAA